jgi:hypothetical protein
LSILKIPARSDFLFPGIKTDVNGISIMWGELPTDSAVPPGNDRHKGLCKFKERRTLP